MIKKCIVIFSCIFGIITYAHALRNTQATELCNQFAQFSPKIQNEIIYKMGNICVTLEMLEKHKEKYKNLFVKDQQNDHHQNAANFSKKEVYYFKLLPLFNIEDQSKYILGKISENHTCRCPVFLIESPESLSFIKTFLESTGFIEYMSNNEKFISLLDDNNHLTAIKKKAEKCYASCLQVHENNKNIME